MPTKRNIRVLTATPNCVALTYTDGKVIGSPLEISDAYLNDEGNAFLESIVAIDKAGQSQNVDVLFFEDNPSSIGADGADFALSAADFEKLLGRASTQGSAHASIVGGARSEATFSGLGLPLQAKTSERGLWVAFVSRGAITLNNADDLIFRLGLVQG